jgi:hypothetical protein
LRDEWKESLHVSKETDLGLYVLMRPARMKKAYARLYGWSLSGQPATLSDVFV